MCGKYNIALQWDKIFAAGEIFGRMYQDFNNVQSSKK